MRSASFPRCPMRSALLLAAAILWTLAGVLPSGAQDAVSAATSEAASPAVPFLGFPSKAEFHKTAGWTSTGLLAAAGVVGAVRALDLMNRGHEARDALGITDDDDIGAQGAAAVVSTWNSGQALRWLHLGLLAAGETLYLGDAITGLSMTIPAGKRTAKSDVHFAGFITHASLMLAEVVLGVFTTEALAAGNHELLRRLGAAHAVIGIAIPVAMAVSGLAIESGILP